jgi:ATP synthase protein I
LTLPRTSHYGARELTAVRWQLPSSRNHRFQARFRMSADDKGRERELSPEEREALKRRAAEIGKRLDNVSARKVPVNADNGARGRAMGDAFKIVSELIVGVVVGGGLGWFLDRQFGTTPWLLVAFLIVGFAAGMLNVIRTARQMQAGSEPLQRAARAMPEDEDDDDKDDGKPSDVASRDTRKK